MDAEIFVDGDFAAGKGNVDVLGAHPVDRGIQGVNVSRQLHHEFPDLVRGDLGADDVGGDVEILGQSVGDGHLDIAAGEGEGDTFFHEGLGCNSFCVQFLQEWR